MSKYGGTGMPDKEGKVCGWNVNTRQPGGMDIFRKTGLFMRIMIHEYMDNLSQQEVLS